MPVSAILPGGPIADEPADVVIAGREVLARGFRPYERVQARRADGAVETRDLLRAGAAVAVFPIDLDRDEGVLIRQVRPAAPPASGKGGLVESHPAPASMTPRAGALCRRPFPAAHIPSPPRRGGPMPTASGIWVPACAYRR